jgi:hypothetical protein
VAEDALLTEHEGFREKTAEEEQLGGLLGQAASAAFGAGRSASFGFSDLALAEGAYLLNGESARQDMLRGLNVAKEVNPYATMGGEAAGLFIGGGKGIQAAGEAAESLAIQGLGKGLGGTVGSMALRGGVEGALMGVGSTVSEATLGDTDVTAEKLFAHVGKDALIGGAAGAGLGLLAYGGRRAFEGASGLLSRKPGPTASSTLDEIAGVEGGGKALQAEAKGLQGSIDDIRVAGATSEQATRLAGEAKELASARIAGGGMGSNSVDDAAAAYIAKRAGGNAEMHEALTKAYVDRAKGLATHEEGIEQAALKMADKGTRVMRNLEDTANEVQFTYKSQQMAKLVDASKLSTQLDVSAKMLQDVGGVLGELEATATKGGAEVAVNRIRKAYGDITRKMVSLGDDASLAARESASRDIFIAMDDLKKTVGKSAGFGKSRFGQPEATGAFQELYERLRVGLEDSTTWGRAGEAQARWNQTFNAVKARRDEFGKRFAVSIDEIAGVPRAELDPQKLKGFLRSLESEADSKISKETVESVIAGTRDRASAIREFGDLSPKQLAALEQGTKHLDEFEATFLEAQKEARVANKIRSLQLEEKEKALGGIIGLGADLVSRPLTSIERFAQIRATTQKVEGGIKSGFDKFFGGKGAEVVKSTARPRETVVKELDALQQTAANPMTIQDRVQKMVGDLAQHAPKTAASMGTVAMRAITYLAAEAPRPSVSVGLDPTKAKTRYSDQQLAEYEEKRRAVENPATVIEEMRRGRLNRTGIRTIEAVYPRLFVQMQDMAREHIADLAQRGLLDRMPMQQQAAIATLLKVPPNETWKPDFMTLMAGAKAMPAQQQGPAAGPAPVAKRPIKFEPSLYQTQAQLTESGGNG